MILTRLRLKNIKSYRDSTIEFKAGINGIAGDNGHGKTTILEAVGYALFDALPYPERDFLRRGAKTGSVEIVFVADDEISYILTRKVGGSDVRLATPSGSINGKKDVYDWLIDHIFPHVTGSKELRSIFENTIGVSQGTFTTAFAQTPSARKMVFDEVLGVDEYRKAYTNLLPAINAVKDGITDLEKEKLVLQTETRDYKQLKKEHADLQKQIKELSKEMQQIESKLEQHKKRKENLDKKQKSIGELEDRIHRLEISIAATKKQLVRIDKDIKNADAAEKIVFELADKKNEYEESENTLKHLYIRREDRNRDEQKILSLKNEFAILQDKQKRRQSLDREVSRLKTEKEQLLPGVQKQQTLQQEIDLVQRELKEPLQQLIFEKTTLQKEQRRFCELKSKINTLGKEKSLLLPLSQKQEHLKKEVEKISSSIAITNSEASELKKKSKQAGEKNLCPILPGVKCEAVTDFRTYFTEEINKRQTILNTLKIELSTFQEELNTLHDPVGQITQKDALVTGAQEEIDKLTQVPEKIKENTLKLGELSIKFQQHIKALSGEKSEQEEVEQIITKLKTQLEALGDAKTQLKSIETLINAKQIELGTLPDTQQQITEKEQELKEHNTIFSKKYAGLNATITVMENKTKKLKSAYETYLRNKPIAERKIELTEERDSMLNALEKEEVEVKKEQTQNQALRSSFSETEFQQVTRELDELGKKLSARKSTCNEKIKQSDTNQQSLLRMESKLNELTRNEQRLKQEQEFYSYVTFIRDLLNSSGQLVVLELINEIASEATNAYCEIMNDYSLELHWNEEYNISVIEGGEERNFSQLSGGEQMSAALATRLSLIKVISKSDVVFLDEPTQNLDVQRRENLSEQIRNIHGFKQLFIISHDDTFNEHCDHIIHVEKINGESRVNY
ncbi:MAG: DNA double-strand break repair Rad50 ATPase [Candidatus Argoarchaeum ethanivorans]|uniref:DNA double-strand break repair Rad50 ATPase n=1 Tax=Candidatus Argoarchaeum ethanivorans TaxID=2608793 RepID=A0A811T8Q7_9EURY|nr:MAG: DNA double-strand break repair Rad50 ATPase [Candidatus Argoarchaeum ethanivorans]